MTRGTGGKVYVCFVKGTGHPGVQSEWVGTTWFRRLVLEKVRYVLQSVRKYSCMDTTRKQKHLMGTVSVRVLYVHNKLHLCLVIPRFRKSRTN
jgi:hypothetical protein